MEAEKIWDHFLRAFNEARDADAQIFLSQAIDTPDSYLVFAHGFARCDFTGASAGLLKLRKELLRRAHEAGAPSPPDDACDELAEIRAAFLAATEAPEWAETLFQYFNHKRNNISSRAELFESAVTLYWLMDELICLTTLGADVMQMLLCALHWIGGQLSWLMPEMTQAKLSLERQRLQLFTRILDLAVGAYEAGRIDNLEPFLSFDIEGEIAPLVDRYLDNHAPRYVNGIAFLLFRCLEGARPLEKLIPRLIHADFKIYVPLADANMILFGDETFVGILKNSHDIPDFAAKPLTVGYVLNVDYPREQLGHPAYIASRIPAFVRTMLKKGQARLILSAAGEASFFSAAWAVGMEKLALHLECAPERLVYVMQNSFFPAQFEAWHRQRPAQAAPILINANAHLLLAHYRDAPKDPISPAKKFLCFNNTPCLPRAALLLSLMRDGLRDDFHYSFNQKPGSNFDAAKLAPWVCGDAASTRRLWAETEAQLPIRLDLSELKTDLADGRDYINSFNADLHADAVFYIITESEMSDGGICRFTEKTVKAFATRMPFLVFGCWHVLQSLRDLGFRTFAPLIDETYDTLEDPVARFHAAYAELRRLQTMTVAELMSLRSQMENILAHNRAHLLTIGDVIIKRFQEKL